MSKPYAKSRFKFYQAGPDTFFLETYNKGQTLRACPEEIRGIAEPLPVAHTSYKASHGKAGNITTYLINRPAADVVSAAKQSPKGYEFRDIDKDWPGSDIDAQFNINVKHTQLGDLTHSLLQALRHDILEFCNEKIPKDTGNNSIIQVPKIINQAGYELIKPGKHDLVKAGKGKYEKMCLLDIGIDLSKGCVTNVTPEGIYDPQGKCSYCYAHQNGPCYTETIFEFDEQEFIERLQDLEGRLKIPKEKTLFVRIGQTTEANAPPEMRKKYGFPNNLETALSALDRYSNERKIKVAFPTKIPDFDDQTVGLLKSLGVSVLGSIAYSKLERGVVDHGYTPERRCELIRELRGKGVNANIYFATDITRDIDKLQPESEIIFKYAMLHNIPVQLLDIRITKRKDAELITGHSWNDLKESKQMGLFGSVDMPWGLTGQNYLHALRTNKEILDLTDDDDRFKMCSTHVIDHEKRCGKCFLL